VTTFSCHASAKAACVSAESPVDFIAKTRFWKDRTRLNWKKFFPGSHDPSSRNLRPQNISGIQVGGKLNSLEIQVHHFDIDFTINVLQGPGTPPASNAFLLKV